MACNPINTGASSYEKHSNLDSRNRLTSIDKTTSDTDLDGQFDADDFSHTSSQSSNLDAASNKLLGFSQTITKVRGTRTLATTNSSVNYSLDQNGNLTSDGLRSFDYDESNRLSKVKITKDGEAASITYLHNALGQRVFKGEPKLDTALPNESALGATYVDWLKKNFKWLFTAAQANTSVGTAYSYADAGQTGLPEWALLGEYDNGSAKGAGRSEYIWLPTEDGSATPLGMFRNGRFFAVHADHLGTPRLVTNDLNVPIWQWPYSAFGSNKPTGVLKATPNPRAAITNNPVLLRATGATEFNLRFPGQYADDEAGSFYNYQRNYLAGQGRYTQADRIGLEGGLSRFGYGNQNALSFIDPRGEAITEIGAIAVAATAYGVYATYQKFKKFDADVKACLMQCENIVACGDPERTALLQDNVSRCKASCNSHSALSDLFGVGKGPTGPKAPTSTPDIFKP